MTATSERVRNRAICHRGHRLGARRDRCGICELLREAARRADRLFVDVERDYIRLRLIPELWREHGLTEAELAEGYPQP